jgi:hypothetical protein
MGIPELESKIAKLESHIARLEGHIARLDDIEEIKRLQRIYGYYLDYSKWDEIADLFSDNAESVEISDSGVYLGKTGVDRCYRVLHKKGEEGPDGRRMSGIMRTTFQVQGVVDIDPSGVTAKGRWQTIMCLAFPQEGTVKPLWGSNIYENEYIKENGKWKFKKLHAYLVFRTPYEDGWVKTPVATNMRHSDVQPDAPTTFYEPYPSEKRVPYHYKHPITGR